MADLFDINVGGAGFHFTSHFIALAALFIACFAIAGYITFKNNSIDRKKLRKGAYERLGKEGDTWIYRETVTLTELENVNGAGGTNDVAYVLPLKLQRGSVLYGQKLITVVKSNTPANIALEYSTRQLNVGSPVAGTTEITNDLTLGTDGAQANGIAAGKVKLDNNVTYFYLGTDTNLTTNTNTPEVQVQINWIGPPPVGY